MHYDFNEFSSHPLHIQSLCGLNLLIIHDFLVIVIMRCFCTNWIPLSPHCTKQWIQTCVTCICKIEPFSLNCFIKSASGHPTETALIFAGRPLSRLLLDITLLSSRFDKAPLTPLDLVLVSRLLNRHQRIVTGAQMSAETAGGGQSERAS